MMKIAFVGNQDNNAYRICKWMRQLGMDADLYMIRQERGARSHPELIDVELAPEVKGYPEWIHPYDDKGISWFLRPSRLARRIEADYDVVVTSGATGLVAANQFHKAPAVHLCLGSEISDFPFRLLNLRYRPDWWVVAWQVRKALRRVWSVVTLGFRPEMHALGRLRQLDKAFIWGFPEDSAANRARVNPQRLAELNAQYGQYDRVFLWLGRLNFRDPSDVAYKAPERFLVAFERIVLQDGRRIRAVIGAHGNDTEAFQKLVADKGLEPYVDYVPHLPFWEILTYASMNNAAVVDSPEMERGQILGGIVRETISVGAVTLAAWDRELVDLCYGGECPILNVYDVDSCYRNMRKLTDMSPEAFAELQNRFTRWAEDCMDYKERVKQLIEMLRDVVYRHRFLGGRQRCQENP